MPSRKPRSFTVITSDKDFKAEPKRKKLCDLHNGSKGALLYHSCFTKTTEIKDGVKRVYRNNSCRECESGKTEKVTMADLRVRISDLTEENTQLSEELESVKKDLDAFSKVLVKVTEVLDLDFEEDGTFIPKSSNP